LQWQDTDAPALSEVGVRVRIHATAVNRADLLQRRGVYPAPPGVRKDILGLEYAGEIIECGPTVRGVAVGDRVMGLASGATYAEEVVVDARTTLPVPAGMSWTDAAALPEVYLTAFDALFPQAGLQAGDRLLITAVGSGVGTAAVQLARWAGAVTFGSSRTTSKLERAQALGLEHTIKQPDDDLVERVHALTGGQGVDVVLDFLGGAQANTHLQVLAPFGRMVTLGLLTGPKAEINMGLIMRKRLTLTGSTLRARPVHEKIALCRDFERVLPAFASGVLKPVIDRVLPIEEAAQAHRVIEANATFGKVILQVKA